MMENKIITKVDISEFWPLSKNLNDTRVDPCILRAQQRELKPFLGEALYFDFINNIDQDNYQELLNGVDYDCDGNIIFFGGVKPLLCAFAYGDFIRKNPFHVTRAGNKNKTSEESVEIDRETTTLHSNEAKSEAVRLQDEARRFLEEMQSEYPLWQKGVNINKPTEQAVKFTRVPRSIQR